MGNNGQSSTLTEKQETKPVSTHKFLIHHRGDHVGVATSPIKEGEQVVGIYMDDNSDVAVTARGDIPLGHKISLVNLEKGEPVLKYGIQIGITTEEWTIGDYVHTQNIKTARW
ncbi:UxaA family hydrolase [Bacillus sp. DTU_2020_1000418_1_SI_GHA_SEK_038]|uniref:UxaA family hydrolase n=1 Tax=Bacillus sp. DTU_2020_1000418_1_SI_GHA_SEK_038 TaxID=3077585 RepID=UPI0028E2B621|nr:UxaA family hydrolase [Bacillus sp. DTU_2020_1000418_1_SI_GHA_SEK_038]WNS76221.1 UxaA family hydrolase [Bacillus sp. DTU_2020_1000418_1_SI_GHA_SEK_038]